MEESDDLRPKCCLSKKTCFHQEPRKTEATLRLRHEGSPLLGYLGASQDYHETSVLIHISTKPIREGVTIALVTIFQ